MEENFQDLLFNYLKENKGTAYTVEALTQILQKFFPKVNKEERKNVVYQSLVSMKVNEKVDSIEHEGELHYFYLKIFDYEQYKLHKTYYVVPESFISAGKGIKRIKIKYCKNCNKEVILKYRFEHHKTTFLEDVFSTLSLIFGKKGKEASKRTGWFCPNCNKKLSRLPA